MKTCSRLFGALMVGVSLITLNGASFADEAGRKTYCGDGAGRICGPLADDGVIENRGVAPNLERGGLTAPDGFRVTVDGSGTDGLTAAADAGRQADVALAGAQVDVQATTLEVRPSLSVAAARPVVGHGDIATFYAWSNYAAFIDHAELRIFDARVRVEGTPLLALPMQLDRPLDWTPDAGVDRELRFVLRVYGKDGGYDETEASPLTLRTGFAKPAADARTGPLFENQRRVSAINVDGIQVTVSGRDVAADATITVMGGLVPVDRGGRFVVQQILPKGAETVIVGVKRPGESAGVIVRRLDVPKRDEFHVAIADLTVGRRSFSSAQQLLQGSEADPRRSFADGRLAFYYKGWLNPDWKLTAAADTGEQRLRDLFDNFDEKDPRALLRRLDPERYYPLYGDDSVTIEDAPTSGRFYARLEGPNAQAMWGNFLTDMGDTTYLRFQRGLYGARADWSSLGATPSGERKTEITAFAADPGTVGSREEFASTGGSVYYLRNQDLAQGSERLFAEIRDRNSGLVIQRTELVAARDYEVNYLQGRILLREGLPITADADAFVRSGSLGGNPVWLVATYEYAPGLTRPKAMTFGGRVQQWLGKRLRIGGTAYRQGERAVRQEVAGADVLMRYTPGTWLRGEFARSKGAAQGTLFSSYGGYDFASVRAGGQAANAWLLEGESDLSDLSAALKGGARAYYRSRGAGFSGPGELTFGEGLDQFGGKLDVEVAKGWKASAKADITDGRLTNRSVVEAGLRRELENGWFGSFGVRADKQQGQASAYSPLLTPAYDSGRRTDAALQLGYRHDPKDAESQDRHRPWAAFVFGQGTLERSGGRQANDRLGVGGDVQLTEKFKLKGEVSDGDLGFGADVRGDYAVNQRGSLYLNYALAGENPDALYQGQMGRLTGGARYRFTEAVSAFAEERYEHGAGPTGLTQAYGVDFAPIPDWSFGVRYETGKLADALGQSVKRSLIGGSADYGKDALRWSTSLEYRTETGFGSPRRETWATRNSGTWNVDPALRLFAKANVSLSDGGAAAGGLDADYYELALAGAWRPVENDRLNLIAKYTYLYDLPSPGQVDRLGLNLDFAQRSHIWAVDGTYQLTPRLALGAKAAYRLGSLRPSRDASARWFDSRAMFLAVRADYRVVKEWDVLVEARSLSIDQADDRRFGALVGVYRHFGDHVKVGVGYNFTDYSDDLSDLSYDEHGFFLNVLGKF